ncbi:MAG: hypothetical protein IJA15_05165, partial [Clostridia bacterium]|nr:hypothetical protein [Clostridia bacterium]
KKDRIDYTVATLKDGKKATVKGYFTDLEELAGLAAKKKWDLVDGKYEAAIEVTETADWQWVHFAAPMWIGDTDALEKVVVYEAANELHIELWSVDTLFAFAAITVEPVVEEGNSVSHTLTKNDIASTSGTFDVWSYNITFKASEYYGNVDGTKGMQIGSAGNPATGIVLTTTPTKTVSTIRINTSGASSIVATLTVKAGTAVKATQNLTSTATEYTFEINSSEELTLTYANNSAKAIYIKSIEIVYAGSNECEHINTTVVSAPTCEEDGYTADVCNLCGQITNRVAGEEKTGHTPSGEYVQTKAPTCTEAGVETDYCTVCGKVADTKPIDALGHDFNESTGKCQNEGCTEVKSTQKWVKVTSAPADWTGTYLIVYEAGKVAFDGSLTTLDAVSNTIAVTINNNEIALDTTNNAASFTIDADGHVISASGYYIGQTSNANGLKSSTSTKYTNTISLNSDGSVNIVSGGAYLRFNKASDQNRFRYYKSSSYTGQQAIYLYKLVG